MPQIPNILSLTSGQYIARARAHGLDDHSALNAYRAVFRDGLTTIPGARHVVAPAAQTQTDADTIKFTQRIPGGLETESVILPITSRGGRQRFTLCVSSQIGCAMGCDFCETAQMGLMRNLTVAEIVGQWHAATFTFETSITNIVFMGMGEPMENLDAVEQAIRILADDNGPAIPASRISISTVGRADGIRRLAALAREPGFGRLGLAVSVNAPNDTIRSALMPINRSTNMAALMDAMLAWPTGRRGRVLIEYVLIPGVNDQLAHADELCAYLKPLSCTVNVIPYNPRRNSPWPAPDDTIVDRFIERIKAHGQFVKRRITLGRQIMGACGQLGNENIRKRKRVAVTIGSNHPD